MTPEDYACVVIGAAHAAAQLCASCVQAGLPGRITVIGDEPHPPYHRPPLSKSYLNPHAPQPLQYIRPASFYSDHSIELVSGQRVERIDRRAKQVQVNGQRINYDTLVLATGSRHRRPGISGIEHPNVHMLKTSRQADAIREKARYATSVVVIGGGFIGLEVASSFRRLCMNVTVLEQAKRVLSRVTSPQVSSFFEELHRAHGVDLWTGVSVNAIEERQGRMVVKAAGGDEFTADLIVVGAGAAPNDQLAKEAGLEVDNGVLVNEHNQTSDPDVYAMGDCCRQFHPLYGTRLRLESVQNAVDQARTVAAALMGQPREHDALPWFWSDQYDVKLQIAGVSTGYDQCVVRRSPEPGNSFSAWYLKGGRLIAVDAVNDARAYAVATKVIPLRRCPDLALVADPDADAKTLLQSAKEA